MRITQIKQPQISFTKKSILKTLFLDGKLPVEYGFYGGILSKDPKSFNVATLEHIQPHSKKGPSCLSNYALATAKNNNDRSNALLSEVFNKDAFETYCKQFKDVEVQYSSGIFKGNSYIEGLVKTVTKQLKSEGRLDLLG